jgi:hypothetical protein
MCQALQEHTTLASQLDQGWRLLAATRRWPIAKPQAESFTQAQLECGSLHMHYIASNRSIMSLKTRLIQLLEQPRSAAHMPCNCLKRYLSTNTLPHLLLCRALSWALACAGSTAVPCAPLPGAPLGCAPLMLTGWLTCPPGGHRHASTPAAGG